MQTTNASKELKREKRVYLRDTQQDRREIGTPNKSVVRTTSLRLGLAGRRIANTVARDHVSGTKVSLKLAKLARVNDV